MASWNFKDLTNQKFGRLTAIKRVDDEKNGKVQWLCQCDCGRQCIVRAQDLTKRHTTSCGCYYKEVHTKHGKSKDRLYSIWNGMRHRVTDDKHISYASYGGRGIKMCQEWFEDFEQFYVWAIESGYKEELTIDRIDVDGDYEPNNCRWVTTKEQSFNKRNTVTVHYNDKEYTVADISSLTGLKPPTIYQRIKRGWSAKEIFSVPTLESGGDYKCKQRFLKSC